VLAIIAISLHLEMSVAAKEFFKTCSINAFFLGLLFIAWSKDKVEDELTFVIRLKSMAFEFIGTICYVIITPIINFLFNLDDDLTVQSVVFLLLIEYLMMYYWQKRHR